MPEESSQPTPISPQDLTPQMPIVGIEQEETAGTAEGQVGTQVVSQPPDESIFIEELEKYRDANKPLGDVEKRIFAQHFLEALHRVPGGKFYDDVGELYDQIHERVIVRREDPTKALTLALTGTPIEIYYRREVGSEEKAEDGAYFNAAIWDGAGNTLGLENAFVEGFSHAQGIVTILGFSSGEHLTVNKPEHSVTKIGTTTLRYQNNVSIEGTIDTEHLRFLVSRIPATYLSEAQLTEDEAERREENKLQFVFRGIIKNKTPDNQ